MKRVPVNPAIQGRSYPPAAPYLVGREKVREFARAVLATSPLHFDEQAARAAGYADVIAPPTFPIVVALTVDGLDDPGLGLNFTMVVHGEQRFEYRRPLHAGDVITTESTVAGIRSIGRNERLEIETVIKTIEGEHVCTAHNVLIERGA